MDNKRNHIMSNKEVQQYNFQDKHTDGVISLLKKKLGFKEVRKSTDKEDYNYATDFVAEDKYKIGCRLLNLANKNIQLHNLTFRYHGHGVGTEMDKLYYLDYYIFVWMNNFTDKAKPIHYIILDCRNNKLVDIINANETVKKECRNPDGTKFYAIEPYYFRKITISTNLPPEFKKLRNINKC